MTKIVSILNITPDSFSDGGMYTTQENALNAASSFIEYADILEIGAESTRPGSITGQTIKAKLIDEKEDWRRLNGININKLIDLCKSYNKDVSLDSRYRNTINNLIDKIDIVNDQSAHRDTMSFVSKMSERVKVVLMHHITIPADQNIVMECNNDEIILELNKWFSNRIAICNEFGISNDRIILDPGIGFGKNPEQSLYVIENIHKIKKYADLNGVQIMIGHSRKGCLKEFMKNEFQDDLSLETLDKKTAIISAFVAEYVNYIRVHNPKMTFEKLNINNNPI